VVALKHDLAVEVLRSFGAVKLRVTGTSMLPSIWPGDVIEVHRQAAGQISPGDVVLLRRDGGFIVHRVVECANLPLDSGQTRRRAHDVRAAPRQGSTRLLSTRGDRLKALDPPVAAGDLLGRVTSVERSGRLVNVRATLRRRLGAWVLSRSELAARSVIYLRRILVRAASPREAKSHHMPASGARK